MGAKILRRPGKRIKRKRRAKRFAKDLSETNLAAVAKRAKYERSPYHKTGPGGKKRRYPPASECDKRWTEELATKCLRESIRSGSISDNWASDFPRYIWCKVGPIVYEARLTNERQGVYHGYPLNSSDEWPRGIFK